MGIFNLFRKRKESNRAYSRVELISEQCNTFFSWQGTTYNSDIVRACIRPKVKAVGKAIIKQMKETIDENGKVVAEFDRNKALKMLFEEPNALMTEQMFLEKMVAQLCINNNAFAIISRDKTGNPISIFPVAPLSVELTNGADGELELIFQLQNAKQIKVAYSDVIHLRQDFSDNDFFGTPLAPALTPLLDVVKTSDTSIISAIKNSAIIKWLLKFKSVIRPEDAKAKADAFSQSYLKAENGNGVATVDSTADAVPVETKDYVPTSETMSSTESRIYKLFNTNAHIVSGDFTEEEWNSYFSAEVQPTIIQIAQEFTRKIYSKRDRIFGNKIVLEADAWATSSFKTRIALTAIVDRGGLTINEWRRTFNLPPVEGGDVLIRRLDTGTVGSDGIASNDSENEKGGN